MGTQLGTILFGGMNKGFCLCALWSGDLLREVSVCIYNRNDISCIIGLLDNEMIWDSIERHLTFGYKGRQDNMAIKYAKISLKNSDRFLSRGSRI